MTAIENTKELEAAVGRAIGVWGKVEWYLAGLYVDVIQAGNQFAALRSFAKVRSVATKTEMTNEAIAASGMPADLQQKWSGLEDRIRKQARRRNKLVHFLYVENEEHTEIKVGPHVSPGNFNIPDEFVRRLKMDLAEEKKRIDLPEIEERSEVFNTLAKDIAELVELHKKWLAQEVHVTITYDGAVQGPTQI